MPFHRRDSHAKRRYLRETGIIDGTTAANSSQAEAPIPNPAHGRDYQVQSYIRPEIDGSFVPVHALAAETAK